MIVKIPTKVRIGAYEYSISLTPMGEDYNKLGQCSTSKESIKIDSESSYRIKCVTFWHEILHAIDDVYRGKMEEEEMERLAQSLTAIMLNEMGIVFDWSSVKDSH